jgi:hypothetical protein
VNVDEHPTLHTMIKDGTAEFPREVRHLLIHPVKAPRVTILSQLVAGVGTEIATGTEYEMGQKADALMQEWAGEGFRYQNEREPVYEALGPTVTLATLMGNRVVYDPQRVDMRRMNFTGAVPLAQWQGRHGKNGGGYQYAFTGTTIIASPTLPPGHGINMAPRSEETLRVMGQIIELQKTVGPVLEFVLG